jgi:hydrogenase nickel incorporation protein HypB
LERVHTANDAERFPATGCRAIQINTGTGCHLDARGRILQVNRALEEITGRPEAELKQRSLAELFVPEHLPLVRA